MDTEAELEEYLQHAQDAVDEELSMINRALNDPEEDEWYKGEEAKRKVWYLKIKQLIDECYKEVSKIIEENW